MGVKREEIAVVNTVKGDEAKERLFDRANQGEVRVLVGSTAKMGIGVNVQERLIALHHVNFESLVKVRRVEVDARQERAAVEAIVDSILDAQAQRAARARAEKRPVVAESANTALDVAPEREYVDDGISGALTAKRESFLRLVEDSAKGDFAAVLCCDISRFGRTDTDEAGHFRYLLRQSGVEVVYCQDNLGTGDEGDLARGVLTWQKHEFLVDLARDTSRGKVRLVLGDPAEVEAVKSIFRQFLDGPVYRAVAERLNREAVPSAKGGAWASTTIREILLNPHYAGDATWNRRPRGKLYEVRGGRPERNGKSSRQRVKRNSPDEPTSRPSKPASATTAAMRATPCVTRSAPNAPAGRPGESLATGSPSTPTRSSGSSSGRSKSKTRNR